MDVNTNANSWISITDVIHFCYFDGIYYCILLMIPVLAQSLFEISFGKVDDKENNPVTRAVSGLSVGSTELLWQWQARELCCPKL